jgi:hypothetical protein
LREVQPGLTIVFERVPLLPHAIGLAISLICRPSADARAKFLAEW